MLVRTLLLLLALPSFAGAIVTANYSAATNDRFADDPSFIGAAYDWSGVGRGSGGHWATLLGDNYFISAVHFHPSTGQTITFKDGNNTNDPTFSYTVAGGFAVPGTDLWIGYTDVAMEPALARYDYTTTSAGSLAASGLDAVDLFMSGDQVAGASGGVDDHVVGTNQGESWREEGTTAMAAPEITLNFSTAAGFDQLVTFENLNVDTSNNFTFHESQLQSGDSGSPLFTGDGTDLTLQGIGWAVSAAPNDIPGNFIDGPGPAGSSSDPFEDRNATYYSYIGSYESGLDATIAMVPPPIPEPSTGVLTLLGGLLILRRKR